MELATVVLRLMLVLLSVPFFWAGQTSQLAASPSTSASTPTPPPASPGQLPSPPPVESECSQPTTWITDPQLAVKFPWVNNRKDCQREKKPSQRMVVVERPANAGPPSTWIDPSRGTFFESAVTGVYEQQQQQQVLEEQQRQKMANASVEELINGQVQAAKWLDACNKRAEAEAGPITLYVGPQTHQPMRLIEEERRYSDLFMKTYRHRLNASTIAIVTLGDEAEPVAKSDTIMERKSNGSSSSSSSSSGGGGGRRKRSILDQHLLTVTSASDGANTKQQTAKYFKAKKTSFRMANKGQKNKKAAMKLAGLGGAPKHLYLYSPMDEKAMLSATTATPTTTTTTTTTTMSPAQMEFNERARKTIERVFIADANVSWAITTTLHSLSKSRRVADKLAALIKPQADQVRGSDRADQLEEQRTSWLPAMESLVELPEGAVANWTSVFGSGGLYDGRAHDLVLNTTHYIQFFLVSFEQMTFEYYKTNPVKTNHTSTSTNSTQSTAHDDSNIYGELERSSLALLCQTEQLLEFLDAYKGSRLELEPLIGSIRAEDLGNLADYYNRTISARGNRQSKLAGTFKSPLSLAYENSNLQNDDPSSGAPQASGDGRQADPLRPPEHVWRRLMPLEQRKLSLTTGERAFRDESILREYNKLLANYDNLLMYNYI